MLILIKMISSKSHDTSSYKNIMPTRLESLLELALRISTANVDPYKDDLK